VQDAIQASGGVTSQGDSSGLNLAAQLEDGVRIQVPAQIPTETSAPITAANAKDQQNSSKPTSSLAQSQPSSLININTASQEQLETYQASAPLQS
jgi:competence protein ComEA